jgi:hypothetical protein
MSDAEDGDETGDHVHGWVLRVDHLPQVGDKTLDSLRRGRHHDFRVIWFVSAATIGHRCMN